MWEVREEPRGGVYAALIRFAVSRCDRFYLVWREQLAFDGSARGIADRLEPWEIERVRTDAWDGTRLLGHYAVVRHYRLDAGSAAVLTASAAGLYDWVAPRLPEDLTFRTPAGDCWLATIAHEQVAWFPALEAADVSELRHRVPGIAVAEG